MRVPLVDWPVPNLLELVLLHHLGSERTVTVVDQTIDLGVLLECLINDKRYSQMSVWLPVHRAHIVSSAGTIPYLI
jgi:hypothetical protein